MKVNAFKTPLISPGADTSIYDVFDNTLADVPEKSIVVVTSKIISLCQGRIVKVDKADKQELIEQESSYFLPREVSPSGYTLSITHNLLVPAAGIDESNGNGYYILWPEDIHETARNIRTHLADRFKRADLGVLITDSRTTPMRWGTTGVALSYAGFAGLNDFIGKPDLFGRPMEVTKVNVADGLAASAVVCMGESDEQTPLACISDADFVRFDAEAPTLEELQSWQIPMDMDLYGPMLTAIAWKKGKK